MRHIQHYSLQHHEESDTRIMVHVADAFRQGFHKILSWRADTDLVVLAIVKVQQLGSIHL